MKKIFMALMLSAASLQNPAFAADSKRIAAAQEYMTSIQNTILSKSTLLDQSDAILEQIKKQQPDLVAQKEPRLRAAIDAHYLVLTREVHSGLTLEMADIFTLEEIEALHKFHSTSIGKSILEKMPEFANAQRRSIAKARLEQNLTLFETLEAEGVNF